MHNWLTRYCLTAGHLLYPISEHKSEWIDVVLGSSLYTEYSGQAGFFVNFGQISYLAINKKNRNDQEPGLILTGNN